MNTKIKQIIQHIFLQTCMICFGIVLVNGVLILVTHNYGGEDKIDYMFPFALALCSILCGITIVIFYIQKIPFIAQCIIHFLLIIGIVTGISFLFHWFTSPFDLCIVYGVALVVYICIWLIVYRNSRISAKKMNQALENTRDSE